MSWWDSFLAAEKNPVRLMWGALPPNVRDAYGSGARALGTLAAEVSPGAAFRDANEERVNMMGAVREGNWMDAAAGPAKMATAMAGIVPIAKGAKAIRAYHGSPHSFDKFDISKIGTGEGAQAYGHGLYFAENEGVARGYRDTLGRGNQIEVGGKPLDRSQTDYYQTQAANWLKTAKNAEAPIDDAIARASAWRENLAKQGAHAAVESADKTIDTLRNWQRQGVRVADAGHMYEVGIHADPAKMLDWDKPLSAQSPDVDAALASILRDRNRTPGDWIKSSPGAEARMQEAGVPGIRYLDQGSRSAGQGSSNYVVFDPAIIEILKKYGLVPATVAAGVGGAAALPPKNDMPPGGLF